MADSTPPRVNETINRFARGELTPTEARELARSSLQSAVLFEELTAISLAKAAVASLPAYAEPVRESRRSPRVLALASASAALVIVSLLIAKFSTNKRSVGTQPQLVATIPALKPTLTFSADTTQPILLADDLQPAPIAHSAQVFRGQEQDLRPPRQTGSVISIDDGLATIDLGSVDGLAKDSEVEIDSQQRPIARLRIVTVFRDQARGEIGNKDVKHHYAVRVSDAIHLEALLQQEEDLAARGELPQARQLAAEASNWANQAKVSTLERANAMELLAKLDFQAGDSESAETHYRAALDKLSNDPNATRDIVRIQNDLATLAILRRDYSAARNYLDQALALPSNALRAYTLNNLGVLAETGGDRKQAESLYSKALEILPSEPSIERKAVEANLVRIKGPH